MISLAETRRLLRIAFELSDLRESGDENGADAICLRQERDDILDGTYAAKAEDAREARNDL
jgi:hypothetical protein